MEGGKWKIIEDFKGNSHEEGGIDILVQGGVVRRIHAPFHEPDFKADIGGWFKKQVNRVENAASDFGKKLTQESTWKSLGAGAYGVGEGLLDTITMGATDQLTDIGYEALQRAGGSSEQEIREQNSLRGYGTAYGAVGGAILSGGAATGSAVQQGSKGLGAGIAYGSPDSKLAQGIGTYLPLAGGVAGMFMGNAGYAEGSKLGAFAAGAGRVAKYNPLLQAGLSFLRRPQGQPPVGGFQRGVREVTPFLGPGMMQSYKELGKELAGESDPSRGTGMSMMDGVQNFGGEGGPIQFQSQPIQQQNAFNYLSRYGINV